MLKVIYVYLDLLIIYIILTENQDLFFTVSSFMH